MNDGGEATAANPLQRALEGERAAREAVEEARREASILLADARGQARAIARRADERIARVSRGARTRTEDLLAREAERERRALAALAEPTRDDAALVAAVGALADRLIGITPEDDAPGAEGNG